MPKIRTNIPYLEVPPWQKLAGGGPLLIISGKPGKVSFPNAHFHLP